MLKLVVKKNLFALALFAIAVVLVATSLTSNVSALTVKQLNLFNQNSIFFYNPDQACEEAITKSNSSNSNRKPYSGSEKWNGSCTGVTSSRAAWLEKQVSAMQQAATDNGLPWELIAAQTIAESGGGAKEVCPYNPLGLKGSGPSCDGRHRTFNSYTEAYDHYVNNIIPIKKVKNKYPDDPYSAIAYIQYGSGASYAQCSKPEYLTNPNHSCYGHKLGDPTPSYVNTVSSIICGIQKWAKGRGIAISNVTWENYSPSDDEEGEEESDDEEEDDDTEYEESTEYCDGNGRIKKKEETPEEGNLADFVKKWAWPNYRKGYTERKQAYADYIDTKATYKGACKGVDCGAFVANIIKASGWDSNYPQAGTATQANWLSKNWNKVSATSLKLGDVGVKPGHVILYVGNISGFNSKTASASQCDRAPMAGRSTENLNNYTWYRKK